MNRHSLESVFEPRSIAILHGFADRDAGRRALADLQSSAYAGEIFVVDPEREAVIGLPSVASVAALPHPCAAGGNGRYGAGLWYSPGGAKLPWRGASCFPGQRLCQKLGFKSRRSPDAPDIILVRRRL